LLARNDAPSACDVAHPFWLSYPERHFHRYGRMPCLSLLHVFGARRL
jgi:hypothetical protein